jgi:hypothetical protein
MPQLELEHDPKLVERLALMQEGNAKMNLRLASEKDQSENTRQSRLTQHFMLAASGFAIAASYWSLISAGRALSDYFAAAKIYRDLGHDYWMVLALITGSSNLTVPMLSAVDEMRAPSPQTVAFALVCNEAYGTDSRERRAERLDAHWRHAGNYPIGRLGIPLDYYVRCARAMSAARAKRRNVEPFLFEAANYVHRAAEVLRSASHDRFHWLRLQSAILPGEPEAVAMTTAMSMMSRATFGIPISELPNLDPHGRLLVEIGDDMRNVAQDGDERHR